MKIKGLCKHCLIRSLRFTKKTVLYFFLVQKEENTVKKIIVDYYEGRLMHVPKNVRYILLQYHHWRGFSY